MYILKYKYKVRYGPDLENEAMDDRERLISTEKEALEMRARLENDEDAEDVVLFMQI